VEYSSSIFITCFYDKIQRRKKGTGREREKIFVQQYDYYPPFTRAQKKSECGNCGMPQKIEKLLLRCVIILILKIHYSNTERERNFKFHSYAKHSSFSFATIEALNDFTSFGDKENLI
jgi:hypothetical protein